MDGEHLRRPKEENRKLTDQILPSARQKVIAYLQKSHQVSVSRACKATGIQKSVYYFRPRKDDSGAIEALS